MNYDKLTDAIYKQLHNIYIAIEKDKLDKQILGCSYNEYILNNK